MTTNSTHAPVTLTERDYDRISYFWLQAAATDLPAQITETLARELDRALVVQSTEVPCDVITMNSRFVVRDPETGKTRSFTLVYPGAEDIADGNISVMTPVGTALIGLAEGDTATWFTRNGQIRKFVVEKVLYQPEARGQFDI